MPCPLRTLRTHDVILRCIYYVGWGTANRAPSSFCSSCIRSRRSVRWHIAAVKNDAYTQPSSHTPRSVNPFNMPPCDCVHCVYVAPRLCIDSPQPMGKNRTKPLPDATKKFNTSSTFVYGRFKCVLNRTHQIKNGRRRVRMHTHFTICRMNSYKLEEGIYFCRNQEIFNQELYRMKMVIGMQKMH